MIKRRFFRRTIRLLLTGLLVWGWQVLLVVAVVNRYGQIDRAQAADVIIMLGAGLEADNTPSTPLIRRAQHTINLWERGVAPVIICTGGKPGTRTRAEADACAELLRAGGIPADAIIQEDQSRSTEENALYTQAIMEANGWRNAILVSDGYHLFRANYLFSSQGIVVYTSPVSAEQPAPLEYAILVGREILALHWQILKELFNLPITYVQSI